MCQLFSFFIKNKQGDLLYLDKGQYNEALLKGENPDSHSYIAEVLGFCEDSYTHGEWTPEHGLVIDHDKFEISDIVRERIEAQAKALYLEREIYRKSTKNILDVTIQKAKEGNFRAIIPNLDLARAMSMTNIRNTKKVRIDEPDRINGIFKMPIKAENELHNLAQVTVDWQKSDEFLFCQGLKRKFIASDDTVKEEIRISLKSANLESYVCLGDCHE